MPHKSNILPDFIILIIAFAALFTPIIIIETGVMHTTHGIFMYPLDDTFIHLDIAKNLAQHGTWGITKNVFASASSSIFYTLLLAACFKIFTVNYFFPFIINCIAGIILLIVVQQWLKKQNINSFTQILILFCLIFFTPLPTLIISGMEHTFQCLFVFLFVFKFSDWLQKNNSSNQKTKLPFSVYLYGMLVTSIRFEGLFLIAVVCIILLFDKKIITAFLLGFISILPIVFFGIYSIHEGSYFLPNSVLLKSETQGVSFVTFMSNILIDKLTVSLTITALATQRLLIILPIIFLLFYKKLKENIAYKIALIILIFVTLLHLSFAATGWFYRYEAYLIFCATIIISVIFYKYWKEFYTEIKSVRLILLLIIFALSFPFILRSGAAFTKAEQACVNIYEQQYQMAEFVKKYYPQKVVAVNDIGAVSFLTDAKVLDLWGLGNIDIAKSKKNNYWTPQFLDSISKSNNAKAAIIYDSWFDKDLLSKWKKVATWKIQNNVICGDDTVSFYAVDSTDENVLKNNLINFKTSLPADVQVNYY